MTPFRKRTIILLGVLAGMVLSVPLSFMIIRWKSENRGIIINNWVVSMRTGNFGSNYLLRAAVAVYNLGNAIPEEALYFNCFFDSEGRKLNSRYRYRIRFNAGELPPVDAFWSLTMYDRDGWLVANPIDRYSLSDRSRELVFNRDGSLDILIQHQPPARNLSNWLPAPEGEFDLLLRTFLPKKELLELKWVIPPVERLDAAGGE
jgi:hypothetical protein